MYVSVCLSVCLSSTVENDTKSENRTCIYDPSGMPDSQSLACIIFLCIFYYRIDTSDCPMRFSALLFSPMAEFTPTLPGRAYEITETLSNRNDVAYSRGLTAQPGCPAIRLGKIHTVSLYR